MMHNCPNHLVLLTLLCDSTICFCKQPKAS